LGEVATDEQDTQEEEAEAQPWPPSWKEAPLLDQGMARPAEE
jgi:hypothetical protein